MSRTRHHHHRQFTERGHGRWHHWMDEVPARARSKALERRAVVAGDLEEVDRVHWPTGRKRFTYYYY